MAHSLPTRALSVPVRVMVISSFIQHSGGTLLFLVAMLSPFQRPPALHEQSSAGTGGRQHGEEGTELQGRARLARRGLLACLVKCVPNSAHLLMEVPGRALTLECSAALRVWAIKL